MGAKVIISYLVVSHLSRPAPVTAIRRWVCVLLLALGEREAEVLELPSAYS